MSDTIEDAGGMLPGGSLQYALRAAQSDNRWLGAEVERLRAELERVQSNHVALDRSAQSQSDDERAIHAENAALAKRFLKERGLWTEFDKWLQALGRDKKQ